MSQPTFVVKNPESLRPHAEYFGISVPNLVNSYAGAGMTGFEVAREGLCIALYSDTLPRVSSQHLFHQAYDAESQGKPEPKTETSDTQDFFFSEELEDFARNHNVTPLTIVRVGSNLLYHAHRAEAVLSERYGVYSGNPRLKNGKLNSWLTMTISPINTVHTARIAASNREVKKDYRAQNPRIISFTKRIGKQIDRLLI